jgi:autoinducer 2-degrading protein
MRPRLHGDEPCRAEAGIVKEKVMLIVHVFAHIKPDQVEAFRSATLGNARHSIKEPGIARFDVIQQQDDPTRFVLVEVYRTTDDPARHKETRHYQKWRDAVADMMAEPRTSIKYTNVFPDETGWDRKFKDYL